MTSHGAHFSGSGTAPALLHVRPPSAGLASRSFRLVSKAPVSSVVLGPPTQPILTAAYRARVAREKDTLGYLAPAMMSHVGTFLRVCFCVYAPSTSRAVTSSFAARL